jgi:transglutaminase-like putative cysteine protease
MTDSPFLQPTPTLDFGHPAVEAFAREHAGEGPAQERAVRLFRAVRDGILYDPYTCVPTIEGLRASSTLQAGRAWCVPKAVLLAASLRACGIPARLGFKDVRNHLSTARLRELMGSDVYAWHGYVDMEIDGRWIKATPAFNERLTRRFGLLPIEFDGRSDSLLHPVDAAGRRHVETVLDRGTFADTPVEAIRATFEERYPKLLADAAERRR